MSRSFPTTKQQQQRLDQQLQRQFGQESFQPAIVRAVVLHTCPDGRKIYKTASELHNEYVQANDAAYLAGFRQFFSQKSFSPTFWESQKFRQFVYNFECERPKREKADRQTVQRLRARTLALTLPTVTPVSIVRPENVSFAALTTCDRNYFVQLYQQIENKITFTNFNIFLIVLMYLYRFGKRPSLKTSLQILPELVRAIEKKQVGKLETYYTTNIHGRKWIDVFVPMFGISSTNLQQDLKRK